MGTRYCSRRAASRGRPDAANQAGWAHSQERSGAFQHPRVRVAARAEMSMATVTGHFTEETVEVAQTRLYMLKGGTGNPLLVLHGVEGHEGWLAFHEALVEHATVHAPSHPGYGHTECPAWLATIPHQAVFYQWFLQEAGLPSVDLVGIGIGGWIAAQMAVMCPHRVRRLILVDAAGLRPREGEILDIFILFTEQPYTGYDPALQEQYPALRLTLPNRHYDPKIASDLYNRYHDEYQAADDVGFDGIMINEHYTAPFCMQASISITGTVLAKITRRCAPPRCSHTETQESADASDAA